MLAFNLGPGSGFIGPDAAGLGLVVFSPNPLKLNVSQCHLNY